MQYDRATLNRLFERYLAALEGTPQCGEIMDYGWSQLPQPLDGLWMIYDWKFSEFSIELANGINQLTVYVQRLRAWDSVLISASEEDLMIAKFEFVDPLATISLNLPYSLRQRFILAVAHLCHHANRSRARNWRDDLPDDEKITIAHADKYGRKCSRYAPFKTRLDGLNDENYKETTKNFRNLYNHGIAPHVGFGIIPSTTRLTSSGCGFAYSFGIRNPLPLGPLVASLTDQCTNCYAAFRAFQALVREHEESIGTAQNGQNRPSEDVGFSK